MDARFAVGGARQLRYPFCFAHPHEPWFDEIVDERRGFRGITRGEDGQRLGLRCVRLLSRRAIVGDHEVEDIFLALLGRPNHRCAALEIYRAGGAVGFLGAVEARVVVGRRLGNSGQES